MADISKEYKLDRPRFIENAKACVEKYAKQDLLEGQRKRKMSDDVHVTDTKISKIEKDV